MKIIWLIFTAIFFTLASVHSSLATKDISHLENKCMIKTINGIPLGMGDFVNDFNKYIDQVNKANRNANILAMVGYMLAGLTAFFSFILYPRPSPKVKQGVE